MDYKVGQTVTAIGADVHQAVTKPPENYTDGTLIAAMTNIHKFVTDPKDRQILKDAKGLGTERTRGAIIEGLIRRKYLRREKGRLIATPHYRAILDMVHPALRDPVMTAKWEEALAMIERGEITLDKFMAKIEAFARRLALACHRAAARFRLMDKLQPISQRQLSHALGIKDQRHGFAVALLAQAAGGPRCGVENRVCGPPFRLYLLFKAAQGVQPARRVRSASHRASRE